MKIHELKTTPEYYDAVSRGVKPFEARKDDRGFNVGDRLILQEYTYHYTGRSVQADVTYILRGPGYGIETGYCILGIRLLYSGLNQALHNGNKESKSK